MTFVIPCAAALIALSTWLRPVHAVTDSCRILNASAPGSWKFIRAYDADTGAVVLRQAINGGDSKPITVSKDRVRVEYKLAGDIHYHSSKVLTCKDGMMVAI